MQKRATKKNDPPSPPNLEWQPKLDAEVGVRLCEVVTSLYNKEAGSGSEMLPTRQFDHEPL